MKGVLVTKKRDTDTCARFFGEADKLGINLIHYEDYALVPEQRMDFAVFRNYQSVFLPITKKVRYQMNDFCTANVFRSQVNQMMNLDLGLPKPYTIVLSEESSYDSVQSALGDTFIAKNPFTTLSKGVFLVHNETEFRKVVDRVSMCQDFINTSKGKDLRILLLGGEVVAAVVRSNPNNWRSNLFRQGELKLFEVPNWLKDKLYVIKSYYGIDMCAVDLLFGDNDEDFYFLEVNMNPYLIDMEEISGKNITRDILSYCIKKCNE